MSSAETLNFGPQWLRDLSGGSSTSPTSPPAIMSQFQQPTSKFKLAENRYGREEMLMLFVEDSEIPEELARAPSLVTEIVQVPLAFRPSTESNQTQIATGFRGRGGISTGLRGRSIPGRGRGRGRGTAWVDHDEGPGRKPPLLRRSESEDWRSDSLRGKGDGAEDIMGGLKEWRSSGQRPDFWKDTWRDRPGDVREQKTFRTRSMSAKDSGGDSSKPWSEERSREESSKNKASSSESPNSGKEKTQPNDRSPKEKESAGRNTENEKPINGSIVEEPSEPGPAGGNLQPKPPVKQLEPVTEVHEAPEVERSKTKNDPVGSSPRVINDNHLREAFETAKDGAVFQNFPPNGSGGSVVIEENPIATSLFQELQKTTESFPPSLDNSSNSISTAISQSIRFSSNSPVGQAPVSQPLPIGHSNKKTSSPIEQLQQLATTWYYKDPQGDVQGPFASTQMMEWFHAGYFTMVLLVKRACDTEFVPLGELIKSLGHVPFTSAAPQQKNVLPERPAFESDISAIMQQNFAAEQQKLQYLKMQEQQKQSAIGRPYQNQKPDVEVVLSKLMKNPEFCRMSPQHQQHVVLQYVEELKRQSLSSDIQSNTPFQGAVTTDASRLSQQQQQTTMRLLGNINSEKLQQQNEFMVQQKLMEEKRRKEEEEIKRIQKQQEEQKELLKKQEEEFQRRKEMLMREQEQIKQLQLEAQRKKEELQRKIEEEERLKKMQELQELERRKKIEEEQQRMREIEKREAERVRKQEEENRKREEEVRKRIEQEEALRRVELERQEEIRRLEIEREERRIQEELRRREERERQMAQEAEIQRNLEAARIQKEKEEQAKAMLKLKQQQEKQMQQIQLPKSARWGQGSPIHPTNSSQNDSLSLIEIQKMEKQFEQTRLQEEARMAKETRTYQQAQKPKSGWMTTSAQESGGISLLDIQREEAKQMGQTKQQQRTRQPEPQKVQSLGYNTSWNKPPKIQPDPPVARKQAASSSSSFWDQVVEENPSKPSPVRQKQAKQQQQQQQTKQTTKAKQTKVAKKSKGDEGQQVKAIFQQQITKDSFTEWCESYLEKMNVGSIDIPTFVNFLRDVESPFEVQEYVQSYLGESKEVRDFANLFLEQRSNMKAGKHKFQPPQPRGPDKSRSSGAKDTDGFEMVTGNAKRGKKKLKKSQKVDPSILGFSVNAASDRVNMGEIQTADD